MLGPKVLDGGKFTNRPSGPVAEVGSSSGLSGWGGCSVKGVVAGPFPAVPGLFPSGLSPSGLCSFPSTLS